MSNCNILSNIVLVRVARAVVLFVVLQFSATARAEINVVRDLGCKLDDYKFDNGPILNAAFARVGKASLGRLNEEFYFPGGAIVFRTPLVIPKKTGISIRGNGITVGFSEAAYGPKGAGGMASRLVYIGPPDKPAITYRGMGLKLDGITLQHGEYPQPLVATPRDGSIGLLITGDETPGTGKIYAPQMAISGFDTAICAGHEPAEAHADQNLFGFLWVQHCWTVFRSDNMQSVGNQFQLLMVGGGCDTVFDMRRGGDLVVDQLILNGRALILKLRDVSMNTASYEIRSAKIDNHAAGWRLVEMQKPGVVRIHAAGHVGRLAAPGLDPIKLLGDPEYQEVEIDFWWQGKHWP